jgi:hypothetical protein|tara:strand:+ start:127 stop:579 length:453 start_codon:yes stop_codon:yes gene_type:complete
MIEKDKITVKVSGSGKNKRALVEEATRFFSNKLMPRMKTLTININLNPHFRDNTDSYGDCLWSETYYRPREFDIRLDSSDNEAMIQTLAHEMVHVKQWAREELKDFGDYTKARWKKTLIDCEKTKYEDLPWEIEAHEIEEELYKSWKSYK